MGLTCAVNNRDDLRKLLNLAVGLEIPYSDRVQRDIPHLLAEKAIPAAVLLLFGCSQSQTGQLLFTRRTELMQTHKGQMAFPGGHCEEDDINGAVGTALRETEEEVGIASEKIEIIGTLPSLLTATGFCVQPVVGFLNVPVNEVKFQISPHEIAEVLWIPVETLLRPGVYQQERYPVGSVEFPIDVYTVDHYRIWGATGSMTKNVLDRLMALG